MNSGQNETEKAPVTDLDEEIRRWLKHPIGTISNNPLWGCNLSRFKGEPASQDLKIMAQMSIAAKLEGDIPGLMISEIGVDPLEGDVFEVAITHQCGTVTETVHL